MPEQPSYTDLTEDQLEIRSRRVMFNKGRFSFVVFLPLTRTKKRKDSDNGVNVGKDEG